MSVTTDDLRYSILALALVFLATTASAAPSGTLRGSVFDSEGAVLNAHVVVRQDGAGPAARTEASQKIITLETDPDSKIRPKGRFELQLEPGFYDVCVMSNAFVPECQKVRIRNEQAAERRFKLKTDPEVVKAIGDTFPIR